MLWWDPNSFHGNQSFPLLSLWLHHVVSALDSRFGAGDFPCRYSTGCNQGSRSRGRRPRGGCFDGSDVSHADFHVLRCNPIDDCWRCDPDWHANRKKLADCGIGFGRNAIGGRDGELYVVTDSGDDDPVNPRPGTLRYAVIQDVPLWITFNHDMEITLKEELIMNSFKTIDGRGVNVHIANGACITIQYITNVIIHGLHIHGCKPTGNAMVRSSPSHYGWRTMADGDAVSIFGSSHIWVDHCSLSNCADGLVDAIVGSTAITISNSYFTHHNEVSLSCILPVDWASASYARASSLGAKPSSLVDALTSDAGVNSHRKAAAATATGKFKEEIIPVTTKVSDGAGAVLLMRRDVAMRNGFPILGVFRSFAAVGVDPAVMGVGPAVAIPAAVKSAGLQIEDIDLFEINEVI
ncbi:hypothetical protein GW17_00018641 [Ensete ventricosum]|nr:hypothetical protein GW17_00018641 [Ensete ventricosum]